MVQQAYRTLLQLYPADYKLVFREEMLSTFVKAAENRRAQGGLAFVQFAVAELMGLATGAAAEWISKLTTDPAVRARCMQTDVAQAERRMEVIIGHMVHAIANHDFPKARLYSDQERALREQLRLINETQGREQPGNNSAAIVNGPST